ncbi:MAG: deoxyribose-phosphate aldolase [Bacillota bacterium]|nr:deoxyribose-phosphate aldolase [Bacillota bacterium]
MKKQELARMIDHTILKPEASINDIKNLCREAIEHNFISVCVNPVNVGLASELLKGSKVKVCTVVGFPLGASTISSKVFETEDAIGNGASEIDMVINVGRLKDKDYEFVKKDINAVVEACGGRALTKVIIETCLLSNEEKITACKIAKEAGADFVKTSTGFSSGGAKVEDIKLMREIVGMEMGVKASGGVRTYEDAKKMIEAGANRIGASASIDIINCAGE